MRVRFPQTSLIGALNQDMIGLSYSNYYSSNYLVCCSRLVYIILATISQNGQLLELSNQDLFNSYKKLFQKQKLTALDYTRITLGLHLLNKNIVLADCVTTRYTNRNISFHSPGGGRFTLTKDSVLTSRIKFNIVLKKNFFKIEKGYFSLNTDDIEFIYQKIQQLTDIPDQKAYRYFNFSLSFIEKIYQTKCNDNNFQIQETLSLKIADLYLMLDYSKAMLDRRFKLEEIFGEIYKMLKLLFKCNIINNCFLLKTNFGVDYFKNSELLTFQVSFLDEDKLVKINSRFYREEILIFSVNKRCLVDNLNHFNIEQKNQELSKVLDSDSLVSSVESSTTEKYPLIKLLLESVGYSSEPWLRFVFGFQKTAVTTWSLQDKYLATHSSSKLLPFLQKYSMCKPYELIVNLQVEGFSLKESLFNYLTWSHQTFGLAETNLVSAIYSNLQEIVFESGDQWSPKNGMSSVLVKLIEKQNYNFYRFYLLDTICFDLVTNVHLLVLDFTNTKTGFLWFNEFWFKYYPEKFKNFINSNQQIFDLFVGDNFVKDVIQEYNKNFPLFDYFITKNVPKYKWVSLNVLIEDNVQRPCFRTIPKSKKVDFFGIYSKKFFHNHKIKNQIFIIDLKNSHGSVVCSTIAKLCNKEPSEVSWEAISKNVLIKSNKELSDLGVTLADQLIITSRDVVKGFLLRVLNSEKQVSSTKLYKNFVVVKKIWVFSNVKFIKIFQKFSLEAVTDIVLKHLKLENLYLDILDFKKYINQISFIGRLNLEEDSINRVSAYLRSKESLLIQLIYLRLWSILPNLIVLNIQGDSLTLLVIEQDIKNCTSLGGILTPGILLLLVEKILGLPYRVTVNECC